MVMTLFCFCRMLLEEPKFQTPECISVSVSSQKVEGRRGQSPDGFLCFRVITQSHHNPQTLRAQTLVRGELSQAQIVELCALQPSASLADAKMVKLLNRIGCALLYLFLSAPEPRLQGSAQAAAPQLPSSRPTGKVLQIFKDKDSQGTVSSF